MIQRLLKRTKVNGKTTNDVASVSVNALMVFVMKVNGITIRNMATA